MKSETSFDLDGDLIVIDATVVGPSGQARVRLVLDTGAVLTTLIPTIAASIGYTSADRITWSVTRTAAATERGYIVRVAQFAALGFIVTGLPVDVADLGYGVDGVLGMNFLSDYNFEIRPVERKILIEKIMP